MNFDLVDLRLFIHIAETKSLTQGAERSHLSLPAVSVRIKSVEERLGTKLLYRTTQGVTLTPAGHAFLRHGRLILQNIEHLAGDLQEYAHGIKGHLRIVANATVVTELLPTILGEYLATHSGINVELNERGSGDIVRAVSERTTDIGIATGPVSCENVQVRPYRRDRLVLATALAHPIASRETISFNETLDYDYVGLSDSCSIQSLLTHAALNSDAPRHPKIRIQVGNFETLCRMVEFNVGVGVLPESAARRHAKTMAIHIVELSDEWAVRELVICTNKADLLPAFAEELISRLIKSGDSQPNQKPCPEITYRSRVGIIDDGQMTANS